MNDTSVVIGGITYSNGHVPTSVLAPVKYAQTSHYLIGYAARQFEAWSDYLFAQTGQRLAANEDTFQVSTCYRDFANQLFAAANENTHGLGTAATPGFSNHGTAIAVDICPPFYLHADLWSALVASAPLFGFDNSEGAAVGEKWHWVCVKQIDELPEADMPMTEADAQLFWAHMLKNQEGQTVNGVEPTPGRAADWLTNLSDAVSKIRTMLAAFPTSDQNAEAVWTFMLGQAHPAPGQVPVRGRAADWITNMSDAVAAVLTSETNVGAIVAEIQAAQASVPAGTSPTTEQLTQAVSAAFGKIAAQLATSSTEGEEP